MPDISCFLNRDKEYYKREEVIEYEFKTLKLLDYNLDNLNGFSAVKFMLRSGIITNDFEFDLVSETTLEKFYEKIEEIIKFFMNDVRSLDFSPLNLAVSSILLAAEMYNCTNTVKSTLSKVYKIDVNSAMLALTVIERYY